MQQPFSPAAYASQITAEQIRWLYAHAFPGFVATLLNASIVVVVLPPAAPPAVLGAWWAWMILVTVGRFLLVQRYHQVAPAVTQADYWRWWFVCGAGATGLGWGFAGLYLFPSDGLAHQLFLVFLLGGMALGAVPVLAAVLSAYQVFAVTTLLPLTVRLLSHGGEPWLGIGVMILSLLGILLFMARRLHASLTNSLLLRFAHEESLRHAKEAAEAAERTKAAFLAMMSHELRTPLQLILGHAEILLSGADGSLADPQREQVEKVVQNACVLRDLITTVLDISRLEAGKLTVEIQEVSVAALLTQIRTEMQEWREQAGVEVEWEVGERLPMLRTDGQKLKVVLTNLLSNAVKFTKAGRITVTARAEQDGVAFCVTDTGIGIPPEALTLVFEPFRQVENSDTRSYGGSGLGLFIVQRLLALLGGRIAVESEVRRGSTFHVWLPVGCGTPLGCPPVE